MKTWAVRIGLLCLVIIIALVYTALSGCSAVPNSVRVINGTGYEVHVNCYEDGVEWTSASVDAWDEILWITRRNHEYQLYAWGIDENGEIHTWVTEAWEAMVFWERQFLIE